MDVTGAMDLRCAGCRAPVQPGDRFCEQCGSRLTEAGGQDGACRVCGAAAAMIDGEGYCEVCGARERVERVELDLAAAAAVSDRGLVHRRNEDAFALEVAPDGAVTAVVCDGISSASSGDVAARTAADAAGAVLLGAIADPLTGADAATLAAIRAAGDAVGGVPWTTRVDRGLPSCTLVCALWRDGEVAIGTVGDSRAYWVDSAAAHQLTVDDSWAQEQIDEGRLTVEEAFQDRRSHSITNWIGADAPPRSPQVTRLAPRGPGRLVLCTDGLWNYLADPVELHELIQRLPPQASAATVARSLTDTAVARGGRDNITVAVIDIDPGPGG
jgi:PPM family protein phosphatase